MYVTKTKPGNWFHSVLVMIHWNLCPQWLQSIEVFKTKLKAHSKLRAVMLGGKFEMQGRSNKNLPVLTWWNTSGNWRTVLKENYDWTFTYIWLLYENGNNTQSISSQKKKKKKKKKKKNKNLRKLRYLAGSYLLRTTKLLLQIHVINAGGNTTNKEHILSNETDGKSWTSLFSILIISHCCQSK